MDAIYNSHKLMIYIFCLVFFIIIHNSNGDVSPERLCNALLIIFLPKCIFVNLGGRTSSNLLIFIYLIFSNIIVDIISKTTK